jgi:hypothetical protein
MITNSNFIGLFSFTSGSLKLIFLVIFIGTSRTKHKVNPCLASISGSEIEYKGTIEIPNFSDEYEAHEIDVLLTDFEHIINSDY